MYDVFRSAKGRSFAERKTTLLHAGKTTASLAVGSIVSWQHR